MAGTEPKHNAADRRKFLDAVWESSEAQEVISTFTAQLEEIVRAWVEKIFRARVEERLLEILKGYWAADPEYVMRLLEDLQQSRASEPPALEHDVHAPEPETGPEVFELRNDVRIYTEVPEGTITVPEASKKYGISQGTIQAWIFRGRVPVEGKLRGSAPGGGLTLLCEDKVVEFMNSPRDKGGRPRKEQKVGSRP